MQMDGKKRILRDAGELCRRDFFKWREFFFFQDKYSFRLVRRAEEGKGTEGDVYDIM